MMRVLIVVACLLAPRVAGACTTTFVDLFTQYENATTVAVVKITNVPKDIGKGAGPVGMAVEKALKGQPAKTLEGLANGFCGPMFTADEKVIVFFRATTQLGVVRDVDAVSEALAKWAAAKTDADRKKLLTALTKSKNDTLKESATARLEIKPPHWAEAPARWKSTRTQAMARLRALWVELVAGSNGALDGIKVMVPKCNMTATKIACADGAKRIRDTMGANADPSLFGSIDALDRGGQCWALECGVNFSSLAAYLSATDGRLLELWLIPEG